MDTVHIQNDRDGGGTDAPDPRYPMPSITSGLQSHSCQYPGCAVARLLNASQCRAVICWFTCAPNAELLEGALQGGSAGCSEHATSNARCCLPQNTDTSCLQCPRGPEHADQDFFATKSCNDQDQCRGLLDDTLNPSTLSLGAGRPTFFNHLSNANIQPCKPFFKRQKNLDRHLEKHIGERIHVCWVPGCQRSFSHSDNLNAHYNLHGRYGGRNRYVATLDKTRSIYDPCFRGQLTPQGWPLSDAA